MCNFFEEQSLERLRRKWKYNIVTDVGCEVDGTGSGLCPVVGHTYIHSISCVEHSVSVTSSSSYAESFEAFHINACFPQRILFGVMPLIYQTGL